MTGNFATAVDTVKATVEIAPLRFVTRAGAYPAAGGPAYGVNRIQAAVGVNMPVEIGGTAIAEAGGAFAVDAALQVDAAGRVVARTSTNTIVGRALEASTGLGARVEIHLIPNA